MFVFLFSPQVVKVYKAAIQQTLDILFLRGGLDVITSSDCVSRDSADRTLIAWDFHTGAKVSNQIYHVSKCVEQEKKYKGILLFGVSQSNFFTPDTTPLLQPRVRSDTDIDPVRYQQEG